MGPRPIVDGLIVLDCVDWHYSFKDLKGKPGQPIARLTPLEWTCLGTSGDKIGPTTHFAATYFTTDQIVSENVDFMLRKFWEIDNCGVESLPVLSRNEKTVLEKAKHSIKVVDGHYQIAIPWKEDRLSIPDSYIMAYQRLQNLEQHLMKTPSVAADYNQVIEKHLKKGKLNQA